VCSDNYAEWTRPALAQILQWPRQWTIPHRLREDAKIRSDHLGLSSLDIEAADKGDGDTNARGAGNIPKSLIAKRKETVTKLLSRSGHQNQFRLDAVTSDVLEPLCDLVEKNGSDSWVFGTDKASSLDCLLLAYLSLMSPPLLPPHIWLQAALSSKYPALLTWTTNFRQECFGGPIDAADVLAGSASRIHRSYTNLPWHLPAQGSMQSMILTVLATAFESLPIVSDYFPDRFTRISPREARSADSDAKGADTVQSKNYPLLLGGLGLVGSALGAATTFYYREALFSRRENAQRTHYLGRRNMSNQRDFGEAGRMLGLA
jgi:sorting and assembly machinery component 37